MYGSKFASTLSKALAARSSADLTAVAATVAAVATVMVQQQQQSKESTKQQQQESSSNSKDSKGTTKTATAAPWLLFQSQQQQQQLPQTNCQHFADAPHHHHQNAASTAAPTKARGRFSRLARRRTIEKMKKTSSQATLESKYELDKNALGEGAFGAVFRARHRLTQDQVAVKKIPKRYTSDLNFQQEMDALLHIRQYGGHPNICGLRENFDAPPDYFYLVLDLIQGGEMFEHLCNSGPYSEADAARLVREVASALAFCHGIGLVHGDLKPENLMLSSENPQHAVIKVVDFGCAQVTKDVMEDLMEGETPPSAKATANSVQELQSIANTPAYCPPEVLDKNLRLKLKGREGYNTLDPSFDLWAVGVIIYIMLTGVHPFDLEGEASDQEVEQKIINRQAPPMRNSELTEHLSESAIDLIEKLMQWDPEKRLTALQMLEHPWVRGETALTRKMADSDKKLSLYKAYKSKLEAKVFADMVHWSDNLLLFDGGTTNGATASSSQQQQQQLSLLERAFHNLDGAKRGYITKNDLRRLSGYEPPQPPSPTKAVAKTSFFGRLAGGGKSKTKSSTEVVEEEGDQAVTMDLSDFSDLLGENMKNRYFPKGHIVYREGDTGDQMFFINSGTIEVTTSDGYTSHRSQGDTFGEGALLNVDRRNTSTIKCKTPVHAIEISRVVFDKFMNGDDKDAKINLSEKDRTRKRERAKRLLRMFPKLEEKSIADGEFVFRVGDGGADVYILEEGAADVLVANGKKAFTLEPGEMCGEHATRYGTPRNTSVMCRGGADGCKFRIMSKKDFYSVLEKNQWWVNKSINDILLRRDFIKAIVMKTGKDFPDTDEAQLRKVFDIADVNKSGKLELDNIREMLLSFDKSFSNEDLKEILDALDLDESGAVSFAEFKRMFSCRKPRANGGAKGS